MSKSEKLTVIQILPTREGKNPDYCGVQVRSNVSSSQGSTSSILSKFLGGDFEKKGKVAIQSMKKSQIKEFGIEVGSDLGEAIGDDLRITVTEKLEDGAENLGFQTKINPSSDEILTQGGADILRKLEVTGIERTDVTIKADGSRISVKEAEKVAEAELAA